MPWIKTCGPVCAFAASHGGKVLLAGDMEQGQKILLAMSAALQYESKWPLLVVSPAQLRSTWSEEAHQWLGPTTSVFPVSSEADVKNAECLSSSWETITSYALLSCFSEAWLTKDRVIIVDESQQLRYEHNGHCPGSSQQRPRCPGLWLSFGESRGAVVRAPVVDPPWEGP